MAKRRKPGAGRKPKPDRKVLFTIRLLPQVLAKLKAQAQTWQGGNGNVSLFTEALIDAGLNERIERERDPALRGLLSLIVRLAQEITGEEQVPQHQRSVVQGDWRRDLFQFRAFKFAVKKLLDTLEEPPKSPLWLTEEQHEDLEKQWAANLSGAPPEFTKLFLELRRSPEAMGAWVFGNIWARFTNSPLPYPEAVQRVIRDNPSLGRAMEHESRDLQRARKALLQPDPKALKQHKEGNSND